MAVELNDPTGGKGPRGAKGDKKAQAARKRGFARRKVCRFCAEATTLIDYKNPQLLRAFLTDRGKIVPARISGLTARQQRQITKAIKRARMLALLPFTSG